MATIGSIAAIIGVVAALAGAAVSAYSAINTAQQQAAMARYNKKVAENAALAQRQAAQIEADNKREEYARVLGAQRAGIGASGVIASEGTPLLVQVDSAEKAALNLARIRYSGEVGAQQYQAEAILQGYQARTAMRRGYFQAGASVLSGISSAAFGYARTQTPTTTPTYTTDYATVNY